MALVLTPHEIRVLGVLIEKSMSTPEYYPMTMNAITAASNQKNNRDPVTSLTEAEVAAALHSLQRWQVVAQAEPERGSRVNRFRHDVEKRFGWNAAQRAVMAELMVRGPQTLGELRSNAGRLHRIEALEYVSEIVETLRHTEPAMVSQLPRQPGKSAVRFAHLLSGEMKLAEAIAPAVEAAPPSSQVPSSQGDLAHRVAELEERVAALQVALDELRKKSQTA